MMAALLVVLTGGMAYASTAKKAPQVKVTAKATTKAPAKAPTKVSAKASVKAASHKPVHKKEPVIAEKPIVRSPDSLEGQVFDHIGTDARLDNDEAARYARIFAFQEIGDFKKANKVIHALDDHLLMGHVLYQRYTGRDYKATYGELAEWMHAYADQPGAQKIYDLALKRKPKKNAAVLTAPRPGKGMTGYHDYDSGQLAQPYLADQENTPRERDIMKAIDGSVAENPTAARRRLESTEAQQLFAGTKHDALQAQIAESYFYNDKVSAAYELASASSNRSGKEVPRAGWIAGLAAWKEGRYEDAAKHFERAATSPRASAWMASAGAYWAARSYLRSHQPQNVSRWLQQAAAYPRSFYGIIAVKALGMEQTRFNWEMPELSRKLAQTLAAVPAGKRALGLMDAGRSDLAEQELRQINPGSDLKMQEAMMAFSHKAGIPAFEIRLGSGLQDKDGKLYDGALYPDAPWYPEGGYQLDKSLVNAFIRQESKFDMDVANKSSGAVGLMQLLPSTAMIMAHAATLDREHLQDPAVNLRLGQKYIMTLLRDDSVQNNLFKLAVAYNAGPGKLARWEKSVRYDDDPLLFIESIPVAETRLFVERVLTNYWIYRLKYNQNTDSLENVASGEWPVYVAEEIHSGTRFADAAGLPRP
jgi:soluble lytic murein transglycosylase